MKTPILALGALLIPLSLHADETRCYVTKTTRLHPINSLQTVGLEGLDQGTAVFGSGASLVALAQRDAQTNDSRYELILRDAAGNIVKRESGLRNESQDMRAQPLDDGGVMLTLNGRLRAYRPDGSLKYNVRMFDNKSGYPVTARPLGNGFVALQQKLNDSFLPNQQSEQTTIYNDAGAPLGSLPVLKSGVRRELSATADNKIIAIEHEGKKSVAKIYDPAKLESPEKTVELGENVKSVAHLGGDKFAVAKKDGAQLPLCITSEERSQCRSGALNPKAADLRITAVGNNGFAVVDKERLSAFDSNGKKIFEKNVPNIGAVKRLRDGNLAVFSFTTERFSLDGVGLAPGKGELLVFNPKGELIAKRSMEAGAASKIDETPDGKLLVLANKTDIVGNLSNIWNNKHTDLHSLYVDRTKADVTRTSVEEPCPNDNDGAGEEPDSEDAR